MSQVQNNELITAITVGTGNQIPQYLLLVELLAVFVDGILHLSPP
jgi:hypothetical protein